ncbi:DUF1302 family protein [Pseudomonas aeruginosa]|nr:DUF1302 family protein [Pseudomonas aeruginosa]MDF5988332.1 DUF1302 family protein [Pseudomonas aeruginosa]
MAFGLAIPYAGEREAKNSGQYGVALRWTAESIGTDFGLFYQRYHDKTPSWATPRGAIRTTWWWTTISSTTAKTRICSVSP